MSFGSVPGNFRSGQINMWRGRFDFRSVISHLLSAAKFSGNQARQRLASAMLNIAQSATHSEGR